MGDEVLVKLSDGTFMKKPLSEVLGETTPALAPFAVTATAGGLEPTTSISRTVFTGPAPLHDDGLDTVAERIVTECHLPVADDLLRRRLGSFVRLFLTGRAKEKELEEFLVRPAKIGGIGFDPSIAKTCSGAIRSVVTQGLYALPPKKPPSSNAISSPVLAAPSSPPAARSAPVFAETPTAPERVRSEPTAVQRVRAQPMAPASMPPSQNKPTPQPAMPLRPLVVDVRAPVTALQPQRSPHSWWPQKQSSVLVGPAEEFGMSLEDFRRLADNPSARLDFLKQKMETITKEKYGLRLTAIEHWKRSVVFVLYLEATRESLKRKLPISEALAALAKEGKQGLSSEEFGVVSQFNEWLGL